jgi:hypothetical protein
MKNIDFLKKLYLNEWANTMKTDDLFTKKLKRLDEMLTDYVQSKNVNIENNGNNE